MAKELLTPETLAEELDCAPSTLAKKRVYGTGPVFIKIGKLVRYERDAVDRWLAEQRRSSTSGLAVALLVLAAWATTRWLIILPTVAVAGGLP